MRLLVVGLSGIGSHFTLGLAKLLRSHVRGTEKIGQVTLCDHDRVEEKNLPYTAFDAFDVGKGKAAVLAERTGFSALDRKVTKASQFQGFGLAVLCVDNSAVRRLCLRSNAQFIDLRAKGRAYACYAVLGKEARQAYPATLREGKPESCQYGHEIESNTIQLGSRVAADIGLQLLLDHLRDHRGRTSHVGVI